MMIVKRIFLSALLLLTGWLAAGPVFASDPYSGCNSTARSDEKTMCETRADAYNAIISYIDANWSPSEGQPTKPSPYLLEYCSISRYCYRAIVRIGGNVTVERGYVSECSGGSVWDDVTHSCTLGCPNGYSEDPFNPGSCTDRDSCLARNSMPGFLNVGDQAKPFSDRCVGGCDYRAVGPHVSVGSVGSNVGLTYGTFEFTGDGCSSEQPKQNIDDAQQEKPQECIPSPVRTCVKPDGKICMASSSGKQFCWQQGETGTKTDGPDMQVRNAGDTAIPPISQLPNGDSVSQQGPSQTTTTTTTDAAGNVVVVVTTTTTNYETENGTNASGGDDGKQGEPSSGDGKPEKDGDTSASGGGDCDTPPIVSGDAALNMVATQAWATRCAVEAGNAAKVSGDIANCASPFTVEGDNANAVKLRAMRKQICPMEGESGPEPSSYLGDDGDPSDSWADEDTTGDPLDTSGFGYGTTCPAIPEINVYGHVITLDPDGKFCWWMQLGGSFVLVVVGLICLRIVGTA